MSFFVFYQQHFRYHPPSWRYDVYEVACVPLGSATLSALGLLVGS